MQLKHWTFLVGICYRFDLRKGTRLLICKKAIIEHTYDSYNKGSGLSYRHVAAGSRQISDEGNNFYFYCVLQGVKMKECMRRDCLFK
jgi:hypothetical protein